MMQRTDVSVTRFLVAYLLTYLQNVLYLLTYLLNVLTYYLLI